MPGLGQGHNQKKDTHTLDFDVTLSLGLKQLTSLIIHFAKGFWDFRLGNSLLRLNTDNTITIAVY